MNKTGLKRAITISLLGIGLMSVNTISAQKLALKSNLLGWGTLTPNVGVEIILNSHFSASLMANYHPFDYDGKPFKFTLIQPEFRYWPGRPNVRHFFALSTFYLDNQIQYKQTHYKGIGGAVGFSYGYDWALNSRWNLEASIGAGIMHTRQFKYKEGEEMPKSTNYEKWLPVPMQCAISFIYLIK